MTKTQIVMLANEFRWMYDQIEDSYGWEQHDPMRRRVLDSLIRFCRQANPAFKEQRFRDYIRGLCGPKGGSI